MTDGERIDIKDYIDARVTPLDRDVKDIKHKVDLLFTKLDGVEAAGNRNVGADAMKATIWKAAAAVITAMGVVMGVVLTVT